MMPDTIAMEGYNAIFFDMDGTLIESFLGESVVIRMAFETLGLGVLTDNQIRSLIGPSWEDGLKALGICGETMQSVIDICAGNEEMQMSHTRPFAGIQRLLKRLHEMGTLIYIVTNNYETFAKSSMEKYELAEYIDRIFGQVENAIISKTELLMRAKETLGGGMRAVVVGDRRYDIMAAAEAGMDAVAVLYGYAEDSEFEGCPLVAELRSVEELEEWLLKKISINPPPTVR